MPALIRVIPFNTIKPIYRAQAALNFLPTQKIARGTFTFHGFFALQFIGFLATAEAVNKESQLIHIFNAISNNHLFMNQIGLRQICSSLLNKNITAVSKAISSRSKYTRNTLHCVSLTGL